MNADPVLDLLEEAQTAFLHFAFKVDAKHRADLKVTSALLRKHQSLETSCGCKD